MDSEIINIVNSLKNDDEILKYLKIKGFTYKNIKPIFENHYCIEYIDLENKDITNEIVKSFDLESLVSKGIIPFNIDKKNKKYHFAIYEIFKEDLKDYITAMCVSKGYSVEFYFAFKSEIEARYRELLLQSNESNIIKSNSVKNNSDFNATEWFDNVLNEAIRRGASDVHIEILESYLRVRYRIDGILSYRMRYDLSHSEISNITVRIKIVSGMDIAEKRKAQDGRIDNYLYEPNGDKYDFRVSSVNTLYGEKFVLRLFKKSTKPLSYSQLGFSNKTALTISKLLKNPNGIIYMAGATGSGKTTTLYSMIDEINTDDINIYTIEDPIEKTQPGVNQIQIDRLGGVTYPNTIRALLRQDPDVIVVGEVRDSETAELAIQASLTGHLVLTTLHANNSIDTISRLYDMNIEPYLVSASTLAFMSQRLVRVLCPHCKEMTEKIEEYEKMWLKSIEKENKTCLNLNEISEVYKPIGCDDCTGGYKGRVAIIEIVEVTDMIRECIARNASLEEIKDMARKEGFKSLAESGVELIKSGVTSISEVMKVI